MSLLSGFADLSLLQLLLVAIVALFAAVIGGLAGYGTGVLIPLVLVPMIGAAPVVPIIAIWSIFTNIGRVSAFHRDVDLRRVVIVSVAAAITTVVGAYGYTRLLDLAVIAGGGVMIAAALRRLI